MLNVCVLQGRFCADPEIKKTQGGTSVCSFSLAVERNYTNDGQRVTDFINCVAWKATAEFIGRYFRKGDMTVVSGPVQGRNWTDKDGHKRTAYEIIVQEVNFCGKSDKRDDDFVELNDEDYLPF